MTRATPTFGWQLDRTGIEREGALEVSELGRMLKGKKLLDHGESRITHHVHDSGWRQIAIHVATGWVVVLDLPGHEPVTGVGMYVGDARAMAARNAREQGIEIKGLTVE